MGEEHWSTLALWQELCLLAAGIHWWHGSFLGKWAGPC